MTIIVLALLLAVVVAAVAYPLLSTQAATGAAVVTDRDIERAVRHLRAARNRASGERAARDLAARDGDLRCPACAQPYLAGDRFCVKCGADLPVVAVAVPLAGVGTCPNCGVPLRAGDVFCSKCGHRLAAGEGV